MARWSAVLDRLAPDIVATLRRFPLASLLCLAVTALGIWLANTQLDNADRWVRLVAGLATAAVFATAGVLVAESGAGRWTALLARWVAPFVVLVAFQFDQPAWYIPYGLPLIGVLYLSIAPTWPRRGETDPQGRFWWMNHQAVTTAVVAGAAFLLISLGLVAIERSVALLFSLELGTIVYRWLVPVAGLLLLPIYWLSTLPHPADYVPDTLEHPDFLAHAAGFLGQFVLAPLLFVYALILLAYAAQIVALQRLPVGVLGWMVLSFVIGGAATYLLVWPPFMRSRPIARLFTRWWFWLTVVPLGLFAVAVGIRVLAYGFTPERIGLVSGGLWAGGLALIFLLRRGDIRIIPGLAAVIILVVSIGPWNAQYGAIWSQSDRLEAALTKANAIEGRAASWPTDAAAEARSALRYLVFNNGEAEVRRILSARGYAPLRDRYDLGEVEAALDLPASMDSNPTRIEASPSTRYARNRSGIVELAPDVRYLGRVELERGTQDSRNDITLALSGGSLAVTVAGRGTMQVPLAEFVARQDRSASSLSAPDFRFEMGGRRFVLLVEVLTLRSEDNSEPESLDGTLFELLP